MHIHAKYNFAILHKGEVMFLYQTEMGEDVKYENGLLQRPESKFWGKY